MAKTRKNTTQIIVESALMIAVATVLNVVCSFIPFLNLPFGGGFTICSMLPIVLIAYRNGTKWGLVSGFIYALIQMLLGFRTVSAFFLPDSDSYMILWKAVTVCVIDYIIAYTVLGFGGIFRNKVKSPAAGLCLGSIVAIGLRYIAHIVSGYIFFGSWAEWFFTQDGFYAIGGKILDTFSGEGLAIVYSIFYNGLYMIPEMVITAVVALIIGNIPQISGKKKI
ncbi:MAG: energy-coupled thiamine transporter ThiT [Clostridia bacterium]|nr:energy-coupled thiamine transporter ThiT [Clostridia bacterium]MBQ7046891.1 energy-coupled thiamine transporter ThiT [Oscillospiraceae bacterium]